MSAALATPAPSPAHAGPWSPPAITRRALADLTETAETMHAQQREAYQIQHALLRLAAQYRQQGASLPADAVLSVLRRLPGLGDYDPMADFERRCADPRYWPSPAVAPAQCDPPLETTEQARRRKRDERLRGLILDLIAEPLGKLIGDIIDARLGK